MTQKPVSFDGNGLAVIPAGALDPSVLPSSVVLTDGSHPFVAAVGGVSAGGTATNLATYGDVLSAIGGATAWQGPVLAEVGTLPGSPTTGDRYILTTTKQINQWSGTAWVASTPASGWVTADLGTGAVLLFSSGSWVDYSTAVSHNLTAGLQGGTTSQYYHLTAAQGALFSASQAQHAVLAAPQGSAGLVTARLLDASDIVTGFISTAQGGTGANGGAASGYALWTAGAVTWSATIPYTSLSSVPSSFTPSAHASTHANGGSDQLALDGTQITSGVVAPARGGTGLDGSALAAGLFLASPAASSGTWAARAIVPSDITGATAAYQVLQRNAGNTANVWATVPATYPTIYANGTLVATQPNLNFIGATVTNDPGTSSVVITVGSGGISALTGDVTASGTGSVTATLASIISAGGPTGSQSIVPVITYDAKGRLTAVSTATITPSAIGAAALSANTFSAKQTMAASASGGSGLSLPPGTAPSSPINGDIWTTSGGLYVQIGGATVGPLGASSGITALTGDVTASGSGSVAATLASVISAAGPIGSTSVVPVITYDAKGRLTAVTTATITPAAIGAAGLTAQTFTGKQTFVTSTTSIASINIPQGAVPTSPVNGDVWATSSGLYVQIAGATVGPLGAGGGGGITALTGDVTASGSGSVAATLASIITAGGPTGSSSVVPVITYDAKGRLTAVTTATITPAAISAAGLTSNTFTGKQTLPASATGAAPLNVPQGTAPTSPNNGDIWTTSGGLYVRIAGATVGPLGTGGGISALTGDVTASGSGSVVATLASIITAGGPTGSTSVVPVITYDAKGRLTAVTTATITPAAIGAAALTAQTFTGKQTFETPTTATASINLPPGTAPTSPANGDVWTTSSGLYVQVAGATVGPLGSGGSGITALTGDVTASGSGSVTATLASIITAGGPTGSTSVVPVITYDAKGRLTAVTTATITPAAISAAGLTSNTFTGKQTLPASVTGAAPLNIPQGTAPTSPTNGDMWTTTGGLYVQIAGATVGPLSTSGGISALTGDVTASGSGSVTATLASIISAGGPTGSTSVVPVITYDAKGRLTAVTTATITPAAISAAGLTTNTFTGKQTLPASVTGAAPLNIPQGTAPTSPTNGDVWTTSGGLYVQIGGATVGPLGTGAGSAITSLTGDVTATGPGAAATTLASIITAGGPTGSTSVVPVITYDAKGRLTAVTTATITPAAIGAAALTANTFTAEQTFAASTTGAAAINIPQGTAPTSPNNGDVWTTSSGLYVRIAGATVGPLGTAGSGASLGANTFTGKQTLTAGTTSAAPLNIPQGSAPTSPTNGDVWTTTGGLYVQINGATVGPLGSGGSSSLYTANTETYTPLSSALVYIPAIDQSVAGLATPTNIGSAAVGSAFTGTLITSTKGKFDAAFAFSGATTNAVESAAAPFADLGTGTSWTACQWINTTVTGSGAGAIFWVNSAGYISNGVMTCIGNSLTGGTQAAGQLTFNVNDPTAGWAIGSSLNTGLISVRTNLNDGNWHFVVFMKTPTHLSIYIDNVLDKTTTCTDRPVLFTTNGYNVTWGNNNGLGGPFTGSMCEMQFYNVALTTGQMTTLYTSGSITAGTNGIVPAPYVNDLSNGGKLLGTAGWVDAVACATGQVLVGSGTNVSAGSANLTFTDAGGFTATQVSNGLFFTLNGTGYDQYVLQYNPGVSWSEQYYLAGAQNYYRYGNAVTVTQYGAGGNVGYIWTYSGNSWAWGAKNVFPASTTTVAPINIAAGAAPTTGLTTGDLWATTAGLFYRLASSTMQLIGGTATSGQIPYASGTNVLATSSALTWTPTTGLLIAPTAAASGVQNVLHVTMPASTGQTINTEVNGVLINASATKTWATSGTVAIQREIYIQAPTYAATTAITLTQSATVAISGAPGVGTHATMPSTAALWVMTGSTVLGSAALATTATSGFLYIPTCAGTPTGTPQTWTGCVPLVYDTTGDKLWVYRGGAWAGVAI